MEYEPTKKDGTSEHESATAQADLNSEQQDRIPRVYIDGCCIRNGASTSQTGFGLFWGDQHPWNFSQPLPQDSSATNNKAELAAAIKALQVARDHKLKQMIVYFDSNYLIQGVTEWINKWKENGWKTAGGDDVKNKDVWMELANLAEDSTTKITWKHVAAHSGIAGNEEADNLAVKAAKQNTAYFQRSEECSEVSPRSIIHSTVETSAVTNSKPNDITPILIDTTHHDMKINMTPNRKTSRDNSNMPVPGSMNGFFCEYST